MASQRNENRRIDTRRPYWRAAEYLGGFGPGRFPKSFGDQKIHRWQDLFMLTALACANGDIRPKKPKEGSLDIAQGLRIFFSNILAGEGALLAELIPQRTRPVRGFVIRPRWIVDEDLSPSVSVYHEPMFQSVVGLLEYLMLLFIDSSVPYREDLCQCKLGSCGRFFLAQKPATGRPRRNYCCTEHMLEAHALQSTKRAQKSRAARKGK